MEHQIIIDTFCLMDTIFITLDDNLNFSKNDSLIRAMATGLLISSAFFFTGWWINWMPILIRITLCFIGFIAFCAGLIHFLAYINFYDNHAGLEKTMKKVAGFMNMTIGFYLWILIFFLVKQTKALHNSVKTLKK